VAEEESHMKNPVQPLELDHRGVLRFKANRIVQHLLDTHPACDMNKLATLDFSNDDRQQFAQLIGYSLSGYGELQGYVDDVAYKTAAAMANNPGMTEDKARVLALQDELEDLRSAIDDLREPVARLMGMHPDDLK
jgi:hypothetical protein